MSGIPIHSPYEESELTHWNSRGIQAGGAPAGNLNLSRTPGADFGIDTSAAGNSLTSVMDAGEYSGTKEISGSVTAIGWIRWGITISNTSSEAIRLPLNFEYAMTSYPILPGALYPGWTQVELLFYYLDQDRCEGAICHGLTHLLHRAINSQMADVTAGETFDISLPSGGDYTFLVYQRAAGSAGPESNIPEPASSGLVALALGSMYIFRRSRSGDRASRQ